MTPEERYWAASTHARSMGATGATGNTKEEVEAWLVASDAGYESGIQSYFTVTPHLTKGDDCRYYAQMALFGWVPGTNA